MRKALTTLAVAALLLAGAGLAGCSSMCCDGAPPCAKCAEKPDCAMCKGGEMCAKCAAGEKPAGCTMCKDGEMCGKCKEMKGK